MPFHRRLSKIVSPATSATFLTLWVLLGVLLILSAVANVIYFNIQYIGTIATSLTRGFGHTGLATFLPPLSETQLNNMPQTIVQMLLQAVTPSGSSPVLLGLQIVIFFLLLSMLLFYGEKIWDALMYPLPDTMQVAIGKLAEISGNTIYALLIIQITAAAICFILAIPFFTFLGYGHNLEGEIRAKTAQGLLNMPGDVLSCRVVIPEVVDECRFMLLLDLFCRFIQERLTGVSFAGHQRHIV
ncbi:hypothetical protein [Methanoregula sp.]|uniref:hypothetical protein n=1 Tax=Methanoregula sp. TaxID=2052170 RepID=UPI00345323DB